MMYIDSQRILGVKQREHEGTRVDELSSNGNYNYIVSKSAVMVCFKDAINGCWKWGEYSHRHTIHTHTI